MPSPAGDSHPRGEQARSSRWRRHTVSGAVLGAVALGLRDALEPPEEEPFVLVEGGGPPLDGAQPLELHFDPDRPHETWVVVRPWLLGDGP